MIVLTERTKYTPKVPPTYIYIYTHNIIYIYNYIYSTIFIVLVQNIHIIHMLHIHIHTLLDVHSPIPNSYQSHRPVIRRLQWSVNFRVKRSWRTRRFPVADRLPLEKLRQMGGSINTGTPIAEWFISWKILLKWMRTGGTPILGSPQITFVSLDWFV